MHILNLNLSADDILLLRRFYVGILGLPEVDAGGSGRLALQIGRTRLAFSPLAAAAERPHRYHFALDVPAARFDAALDWLAQRCTPIAAPGGQTRFHSESWNADMLYFTDPQGSILELIARRTLPHADDPPAPPGSPFDAAEITAVSEIGLAVDSVPDAVARLSASIPGLAPYNGPGSDTFTAVGDHHGLLIVVSRERIWFPETGVPAQPLPLEVVIEQDGRSYAICAPPYPFAVNPAAPVSNPD